jgi:hypothetical protein
MISTLIKIYIIDTLCKHTIDTIINNVSKPKKRKYSSIIGVLYAYREVKIGNAYLKVKYTLNNEYTEKYNKK